MEESRARIRTAIRIDPAGMVREPLPLSSPAVGADRLEWPAAGPPLH